jgi:Arc/MetJ-type ribon-helix-helix transcriptional regulator
MTIQLPHDIERDILAEVQSGHFASVDEALAAAWRSFQRPRQPASATNQPELTPEEIADQELQHRLLAAGVISEIKPPSRLLPARERFEPIPITGEPLSATVISERR